MSYDMLANEVKTYIKQFCYLDAEYKYDIATLWIFHTHVRSSDDKLAFYETPRLAILSDMPASGKTRLLELIESLAFNGQRVLSPSAAGLLDALNEDNGSIAIDEIDLLFGRNSKQELRTIINGGYKQGSFIRYRNQKHDTFGPIVLAGMGQNFMTNDNLAATRSRSIVIRMDRRPENANISHYRAMQQRLIAGNLKECISDWGRKHCNELAMAFPDMPDGIVDRDADIWSPLIATGEYIGNEWLENAIVAAKASVLSENTGEAPMSPTQKLLHNLTDIFYSDEEKISTLQLVNRLKERNMLLNHSSITAEAMELGRLLSPTGIKAKKIHDPITQKSCQGFEIESFIPFLEEYNPIDRDEELEDVDSLPFG